MHLPFWNSCQVTSDEPPDVRQQEAPAQTRMIDLRVIAAANANLEQQGVVRRLPFQLRNGSARSN